MAGPREAVHDSPTVGIADTRRDKSPGDLMSRKLMRILGMIFRAVDDDPADSMRLLDDATTASVSRRRSL
jgi:hypothetical protein